MDTASLQFLLFGLTEFNPRNAEIVEEAKLPRRDWILLPGLSLLTILVILVSVGWVAHKNFSRSDLAMKSCLSIRPPTGVRGIPNSECWVKEAESPLVNYKFNSCGHRAGMECGPKPPRTYRIVMVGSSFPFGHDVQREKTLAALLPTELSLRTGRKVDLYNESMWATFTGTVASRFNETLPVQPDLILWVFTRVDIERASIMMPDTIPQSASGSVLAKLEYRVKQTLAMRSLSEQVGFLHEHAREAFNFSETGAMLMHTLYQSHSLYMKAALPKHGNHRSSWYVEAGPTAASRTFLQQLDGYVTEMAGKAKAAGVPLVAVLAPDRLQAALISTGEWPSDFNPYELDDELRAIMESHGATYIDILPGFRNVPRAEQYYSTDGHPDERWQPIVSGLLARELTSGAIPALKAPAQERAALEQAR